MPPAVRSTPGPGTRSVGRCRAVSRVSRRCLKTFDLSAAAVVALVDRLLDDGLAFQSHEVLEAAWKGAEDDQRAAWQGMAQLAVALTHALRGNATGARRLRERAEVNLAHGVLPGIAVDLRERLRWMCDEAGVRRA